MLGKPVCKPLCFAFPFGAAGYTTVVYLYTNHLDDEIFFKKKVFQKILSGQKGTAGGSLADEKLLIN